MMNQDYYIKETSKRAVTMFHVDSFTSVKISIDIINTKYISSSVLSIKQ